MSGRGETLTVLETLESKEWTPYIDHKKLLWNTNAGLFLDITIS